MNDHEVARDPWRGVHNAIRDSILSGDYAPGDRLVEQQLADRFGTSRGPVRTALQELERSGLVESIDRRGTFVRSLSDADMEEIFSLTHVLSAFVIRRAIERIGPEERQWIEDFKAKVSEVKDLPTWLALSIDHGRHLYQFAQHRRALEIYESLMVQAHLQALFATAAQAMEDWRSDNYLEKACDALIRGDVDAALAINDQLIQSIRDFWLNRPERTEPEGQSKSGTRVASRR
jgi:DNA-binding GntR family transcriptional regulator